MHELDILYDTCKTLTYELEDANEKIKRAGGKLTGGDLSTLDTITHSLKSVLTSIAMKEAENNGMNRSSERRSNNRNSYDGDNSYENGNSNDRSYDNYGNEISNARGRTGNVRRDSMGRYSRDEAEDDLMEKLREYMHETDDPTKKQEIKRFMKKLGEM